MATVRQATPKTTAKATPMKPGPIKSGATAQSKGLMPLLVGLLFPLVATFLDIGVQSLPFSLGSVLTVQQTQPLHWLLDLVPLVMWLVAAKSSPPPRIVTTAAGQSQERRPAGPPVLDQTPQQQRSITTLQTELATVKSQFQEVQARELAARAVFDDIKDAIFILTIEGIVTDMNQSAEQALGWSRQEILGHPIQDLLTLASVPQWEAHLADVLMSPSAALFCEVEFVHSNGRSLWAEGCMNVLRNEAKEATGLLVTYRDLSHRRSQADIAASPPELAVSVQALVAEPQQLVAEPQQEESSSPPLSYRVTDSGALTVPGLFAERPHITGETGDDHPDEIGFQEASFAALQEPAETLSVLSSVPDTETISFVSPPRFAFADEPETSPALAPEAGLTDETVSVSSAPEAVPDGEIFNLTEALSHVGGDEGLLAELATLFLQEYPEVLRNLRAAVDSGDAEAIMYFAHALRGSMSNFVTLETENAARRLEQIGREGEFTHVARALDELETALQRLVPALHILANQVAE